MKKNEQIYKVVALIINSMLLFPESKEIMNCALLTLERLYDTFESFRPNLEEPILSVMQNIIENADKEEQIKKAVIFSYKLQSSDLISE